MQSNFTEITAKFNLNESKLTNFYLSQKLELLRWLHPFVLKEYDNKKKH